jgi:hypothetical protein
MELATCSRYSHLANVKPACDIGVWDMSEVECNNVRLDQCINRYEEGGVGGEVKVVNAPIPLKKFIPESHSQSNISTGAMSQIMRAFT